MKLLKTIYEKIFNKKVKPITSLSINGFEIKFEDIRNIKINENEKYVSIDFYKSATIIISFISKEKAIEFHDSIYECFLEWKLVSEEALKQSLRDEIRIQSDKDFFNT